MCVTAKCADRNAVQALALSRTPFYYSTGTPLLITVVARRSPKGMEYNVGTGDGDRRYCNVVGRCGRRYSRDTAMSVRQIRLVVPSSHAERLGTRSCCMDEGTYDAVGTDWKSGTVPTEAIGTFGLCKIGSVRYADVLG